eukprot:4322999-Amphidinium_carterae.1
MKSCGNLEEVAGTWQEQLAAGAKPEAKNSRCEQSSNPRFPLDFVEDLQNEVLRKFCGEEPEVIRKRPEHKNSI